MSSAAKYETTENNVDNESKPEVSSPRESLYYENRCFSDRLPTSDDLFQQIDRNDDGYIEAEELREVLRQVGLALNEKQVTSWMDSIDLDHDGKLNKVEFKSYLKYARDVIMEPVRRKADNEWHAKTAVFLGGSCNPTTWRQDITIPILEKASITYYNPQTDDWTEDLMALENEAKENALVLLFVIDGHTRSLASMIEATELIVRGRKIVLVINDIKENTYINEDIIRGAELKDLNRARAYLADTAARYDVIVYENIPEATCNVVHSVRKWESKLQCEQRTTCRQADCSIQ